MKFTKKPGDFFVMLKVVGANLLINIPSLQSNDPSWRQVAGS